MGDGAAGWILAASTSDTRCQATIFHDKPCHQQGLRRLVANSRQCRQVPHCDRQRHLKYSQNTPSFSLTAAHSQGGFFGRLAAGQAKATAGA